MATAQAHQNQVKVASGLDIVAGAWLFISPWVILMAYNVAWSNWIVGAVVMIIACIRAFGAYSAAGLSWFNAILGLWVLLSPWFLVETATDAAWGCNVLTGAAIIILAAWSAIATHLDLREHRPIPAAH